MRLGKVGMVLAMAAALQGLAFPYVAGYWARPRLQMSKGYGAARRAAGGSVAADKRAARKRRNRAR